MLQRIFFVSSLTFAISVLAFLGTVISLFSSGSGGWDEFFLEHTHVDILSVQPKCLEIIEGEERDGTYFEVSNRCGEEIRFDGSEVGVDRAQTSEEQLSSVLSGREYDMLPNGFWPRLVLKWEVRGSVGDEPLLISGRTRADIFRTLNLLNYFLIPFSFLIAATLGIVNFFSYKRKRGA